MEGSSFFRKYWQWMVALLLLLSLQLPSITTFPQFIHAWSQSDRYALALNFYQEDASFFLPETYNLNVQFPAAEPLEKEEGITAVDFPIVEYGIGQVMKLIQNGDPWVYRSFVLLISLLSSFYMLRLSSALLGKERTIWGLLPLLSPVYQFYYAGFNPGVVAIGLSFCAAWYLNRAGKGDWIKALLLFMIAGLIRTPFVIPLIALLVEQVILVIKKEGTWKKVVTVSLTFLPIAIYFGYNATVRETYGSIFLANPLPAQSFGELIDMLGTAIQRWGLAYFSWSQWLFVLIALGMVVFRFFKTQNSWDRWLLGTLAGGVLYALLMARQLPNHDYYFIDVLLFPLSLLFLSAMKDIRLSSLYVKVGGSLVLIGAVLQVRAELEERRAFYDWSQVQQTYTNFQESDEWLDSCGVEQEARILVIDAYTPNIPFIQMKRKGYSLLWTTHRNIKAVLEYDYDWVVLQNQYIQKEIIDRYPEIEGRLVKVADNGKLSLFRSRPLKENILMQVDRREAPSYGNWYFTRIENGNLAMNEQEEWGSSLKIDSLPDSVAYVRVECLYKGEIQGGEEVKFCADLRRKGKTENKYWNIGDLQFEMEGEWKSFVISFPVGLKKGEGVAFYWWNKAKKRFEVKDWKMTLISGVELGKQVRTE